MSRTITEIQQYPPTLYVDGEAQETVYMEDVERVHVEWLASSNGEVEDDLVNSCAIDWSGDEVAVTISTGDPRGAFCMTVRRLDDGTRLLHVPYPGMGWAHEDLAEISPGTYEIGVKTPSTR